ncbi:MAG TPA: carboxy terminal-processing peptidase, partial [Saprospiraceae bacterium]|nr:carboxy terminal-processing peptidase [Saprospiraceae bacterium]
LRNNGGGSLNDVVKMTGLFIEKGPIVQVKTRLGDAEVQQDYDSRVQYGGPLIIMVNNFSASASEIMAAALQDYSRAVIVGSNHTFGKGTVQRFFDLDNAVNGYDNLKPLGDVKITLQKFYRINGGSTQLRGVSSDIVLPDNFQDLKLGEKESKYAMPWSQIDKLNYSQNVYNIGNVSELAAQSKERVGSNEIFSKIAANAKRLKKQRDQSVYSLNIEEYQNLKKNIEKESEQIKKLSETEIPGLAVSNLNVDLQSINSDSTKINRNAEFLKDMKKDIYVDETLNIMADLIRKNLASKN